MTDLRAILSEPTLDAGRELLGARIVREEAAGARVARIVEVEAYIGEDDRASHARFGRTARNAVMYGLPGTAYVYLVYGMHDCLNIVTEPAGRHDREASRARPVRGQRWRELPALRVGRGRPVLRGVRIPGFRPAPLCASRASGGACFRCPRRSTRDVAVRHGAVRHGIVTAARVAVPAGVQP